MYGEGTMTLREQQQEKVQVCEKKHLGKNKCGIYESWYEKNGRTVSGDWSDGKFIDEIGEE